MKKMIPCTCLAFLLAGLFFSTGCKKKKETPVVAGPVPVVQTISFSNVLLTTASLTGSVTSDAGSYVSKRGFCWSRTSQNPTIQNDTVVYGEGAGSYSGNIKGLKGQSKYYARAYATNANGTGYGSTYSFTTIDSTIKDVDNNRYRIVQIGSQVWMAENLKTTRYNNGTPIPLVTDSIEWCSLTYGGYCWYNNDQATYGRDYGALYNWFAASVGNLAPTGWHVPSSAEFTTLINLLGDLNTAGGKLKETGTIHWLTPNTGADNSSGFTALPGGQRTPITAFNSFTEIGYLGSWWSTTHNKAEMALCLDLRFNKMSVYVDLGFENCGYSIRCLRD